jgi:hypothetical protein
VPRDLIPRRARLLGRYPYRQARRFLRGRYTGTLQRVPDRLLPGSWRTAPPDFVGVGAQKAGTSWWCAAIEAHPGVRRVPGAPKECHYFDRLDPATFSQREVDRYHRLFPRPSGAISGEWTPGYMHQPHTPALLGQAVPDARLIAMLRDPIDRYRSALTIADTERLRPGTVADEAFERGLYFRQLSRLLEHFDREQLLVLQYERCRAEPERELRRTFEFLGLGDVGFVPPLMGASVNVTRARKVTLPESEVAPLRERYRGDALALVAEFPEIDPGLWTTLAL